MGGVVEGWNDGVAGMPRLQGGRNAFVEGDVVFGVVFAGDAEAAAEDAGGFDAGDADVFEGLHFFGGAEGLGLIKADGAGSEPFLGTIEDDAYALVGSLDDTRASYVREVVLESVVTHRARVLIVDLTGLRAVDGPSADRILGLVAAVQLVGSRVVLTGIRPAIAAALIDVGFTSRPGLSVLRTLEDAVRTTLIATRA